MNNRKDLFGGVIIIVLLLLVLVTYIGFYNYNKEEDLREKESIMIDNSLAMINIFDDYTSLKVLDKEEIANDKNIIGTYNCKNDDCNIFDTDLFKTLYDEKYVIINESKKFFIFDFTLNKVVSNLYDDIISEVGDYYVVKDIYKYGVISKSGFEVIIPNYDEILTDNIYDSYIKVKNNNMYGVVDLDNGNVVVDTIYKDINVTDSKYYSIMKDNLWYIIDTNGNVVSNGFEYVFAFNKGFIAYIDNNLYILKYNSETNEQLNNNVISVGAINNFIIKRNGSVITIEVGNGDNSLKYQYNISRNNLTSK